MAWSTSNGVWRVSQVMGQLVGVLVCTSNERTYRFDVDGDGQVEIRNSRGEIADRKIPGYVLARISATAYGGSKPLHKKMTTLDRQ